MLSLFHPKNDLALYTSTDMSWLVILCYNSVGRVSCVTNTTGEAGCQFTVDACNEAFNLHFIKAQLDFTRVHSFHKTEF